MFFLSGAVGLLYEVAWFRKVHLLFGVSIFAIGAVVAAYMLGLAAGSQWAGSYRKIRKNPLIAYAWFEVGIAIYALIFPLLVGGLESVYALLFRLLGDQFLLLSFMRFLLAFVLLLPPTFLMGATLPAMAQAVVEKSEGLARKVGRLYAVNTIGGIVGILFGGFFAIEHFGIRGSIYIGVVGNLVVALSAFLLSQYPAYRGRKLTDEKTTTESVRAPTEVLERSLVLFSTITVCVTGLVSMAAEILWTRALVFYIHNSTYAFSCVLAVYLSGIGAGAAVATRFVRTQRSSERWLAATLTAACLSLLLSILIYRNLPELAKILAEGEPTAQGLVGATSGKASLVIKSWSTALVVIFGQVAAVLFLPAFLFGLVFPLALRLVQEARQTAAEVVGRLYAANTVGSVVGTVLGTFILVALFGTRLALLLLAWLPVPIAMWAMMKVVKNKPGRVLFLGLFPAALAVSSLLAAPPGLYREMFQQRFGKVVWFSEGVSETVAVCERSKGNRWIHYSDGRGASGTGSFRGGWLYAHLPLLLHPNPQSALVICFGTGNTLGAASLHPLKVLDGVELSSEVIKASHMFSKTNHNVVMNEKVNIIIEDGRNYLLATNKRYDVITAEPPLVHTAGVVNLYSRDFYELCSNRLSEDGIMGIWLATWELENHELKMLIKAFVEAFPHTSVWDCTHPREWFLIGSKKPLEIDIRVLEQRMSEPRLAKDLHKIDRAFRGIKSSADLLSLYLKGRKFLLEFAGDVDPVTDDKTVVDFTTPRHARANFGLGEPVTGGLSMFSVGSHGLKTENRLREFDSIYALRESVAPLIGKYGSHNPSHFLNEVERKKWVREISAAAQITKEVKSLATEYYTLGNLQKSLDTLNRGLGLVPPEATAQIHEKKSELYFRQGRNAQAKQASLKAREMKQLYKQKVLEARIY